MEELKRPRLQRKFYSKLLTAIALTGVFLYSLFNVNDSKFGPIYFLSMLITGILAVYLYEGVGRVNRRLKGEWE